MDDLKEIAVAWGLALVLLGVGVGIAEFATRQPNPVGPQSVARFSEPLPSADAPSVLFDTRDEEFR